MTFHEFGSVYLGTEDSAQELIDYIDLNCNSGVFALCGVSLGGQIVIEMLSQRPKIAKKAIIDGSLCYPCPIMSAFCIATVTLLGKLIFLKRHVPCP